MNRIRIVIALSLILTGCDSNEVRQSDTDVLQRQQIEKENAAREARVKDEQAELARIRAQQRKRDEPAQPAPQAEVPVLQPLEPASMETQPLVAPPSMQENPDNAFAERTIYYAYDAYNLAEEYRRLIEAHSKFLLAHQDRKLRIEGHCDDRGSREYNLALGQRRADAIKRALTLLGVPARQIQTVSFGAEKPKASGQSETAYAQNRRVDLVYLESGDKRR
jgi:peptidoglycan-associated lipoprotein